MMSRYSVRFLSLNISASRVLAAAKLLRVAERFCSTTRPIRLFFQIKYILAPMTKPIMLDVTNCIACSTVIQTPYIYRVGLELLVYHQRACASSIRPTLELRG